MQNGTNGIFGGKVLGDTEKISQHHKWAFKSWSSKFWSP